MSETRPQPPTETQQLLRFTARDPYLFGGLQAFEQPDSEGNFPKDLFMYAMKGISYDPSNPQAVSTFGQFRLGIDQMTNRGLKRFNLRKDFVKEIRKGGLRGETVGVQLRVALDAMGQRAIIGPMYGQRDIDDEESVGELTLAQTIANENGLPIFYRFARPVAHPELAVGQLRSIVKAGAWVSQITVVPPSPDSARERDIFMHPRIDITQEDIDRYIGPQTVSEPVVLSEEAAKRRASVKNAS